MAISRRSFLMGLTASMLARPALAASPQEVDLNLVLLVDCSRSVTDERWETQMLGYADACADPEIQKAMLSGELGAIAIAMVAWASNDFQRLLVPWTLIDTEAAAGKVASIFSTIEKPDSYKTSISSALMHAAKMIRNPRYEARRQVFDVSADGWENQDLNGEEEKSSLPWARDQVLREFPHLTINGLVLLGAEGKDPQKLITHIKDQVIGGPNCFHEIVKDPTDRGQVSTAVKKKMHQEILIS